MDSRFPWRKLMAVTLLAIVAIFTGLYFYRLALAETFLAGFLESRGLEGDATVTRLSPAGVRFEHVRLENITADAIDVRWRWTAARGLAVSRVEIDHPLLHADFTAQQSPFSALRNAFGNDKGTGPSAPSRFEPPTMIVKNGRARLQTPAGNLDVGFSIDTHAENSAARTYAVTISARGPDASATGDIRFDWGEGAPLSSLVSIVITDERDALQSTGRLALRWHTDQLDADLVVSGGIPASMPARLGVTTSKLAGLFNGEVGGTMSWNLADGESVPAPVPDHARLRFRLAGTDLNWPAAITGGDLRWSGEMEYEGGQDLLSIRPSSALAVETSLVDWQPHLPVLAEFATPDALDHLTLTVETALLRIQPMSGLLSADNVRMKIAGSDGNQLQVEGPWQVRLAPALSVKTRQEVMLQLPDLVRNIPDMSADGALTLDGGPDDFTLTLDAPLSLEARPSATLLPGAVSWLGDSAVSVHTEARSASGQPCFVLLKRGGELRMDLDCRVTAQSKELGNTDIRLSGMVGQAGDDRLDLNLSELSLRSAELRTPYGPIEHATASGSLAYRDGHLDVSLAAEAEARVLQIRGVEVDEGRAVINAALRGPPQALRLSLASSSVEARVVTAQPAGIRATPVSVAVEATDLGFRSGVVSGKARLTTTQTTLEAGDVTLALGTGETTLSTSPSGQPSARLRIERVEDLPRGLGLYDLEIDACQRAADRFDAELLRSTFRDLMLPQRFPPSKWSGTFEANGAKLRGRFEARPETAPQVTLTFTGRYDVSDDQGHADASLDGMAFGSDLQPRELWPAVGVANVTGGMDFAGEADFDSSGLTASDGRLVLDLARFENEGTWVTGLSLPLDLSSLWPVESPPDQRLTVDRIGDGTGASNLQLVYRLVSSDDGLPVIEISHGEFATLGGRIQIAPTRLDSRESIHSLVLQADHLDLVSVLSLISSEGIDGEGHLSGRFPIRFEGQDLVIDGAVLESEAPGRLAFSSAAASQTLKSGGDHMALLLKALENFYYERLSLSVDKAAAGDAHLQLALRGHNPDVLDGYPFAINIDLQTDVAPFLSVLREGNDMVDEVVKRIWRR